MVHGKRQRVPPAHASLEWIAADAESLGWVDHVVGLAADHANGPVTRIGPTTLASKAWRTASAARPVRVNAISPGIIDSGAWDSLGDQDKARLFADTAASNPARRIGTPADVSAAALSLLGNGYITGTTLHVDGGGRLA